MISRTSRFKSDRDAHVHRIEETIIGEMAAYANICKSVTEDAKACSAAQDKELAHHKYVTKLRQQNPLGRMQISKAESDLQQARPSDSIPILHWAQRRIERAHVLMNVI